MLTIPCEFQYNFFLLVHKMDHVAGSTIRLLLQYMLTNDIYQDHYNNEMIKPLTSGTQTTNVTTTLT